MQGQYVAPTGGAGNTSNNNNAWGIANTPSGSAAAGPLSTMRAPNTYAVPTPGTLVIHMNARVEADFGANWTTADKGTNANGTPNGYKVAPMGVASDIRLYWGADGVAANGLRYGAAIEAWQNFYGGTNYNAGINAGGLNASGSGNTSGQTIFVRKEFVYLASDKVGVFRLGGAEGVIGLLDPCIFSSQCWDAGMGTLNGGGPNALAPQGAMGIPWVWASQSGAEYATNKIAYLSPQVYGFDFAFSYAPSKGNLFADQSGSTPIQPGVCNQAGPNCLAVTSGNDSSRWINATAAGLRYQHTFGAVDFKAFGLYEISGKESLSTTAYLTPAQARTAPGIAGLTSLRYNNLGFFQGGVAITYSNFTYAIDYMGGQVDGQLSLNPEGGVSQNAVVTGLTYVNGPWTAGAMIESVDTQGDARLVGVSQRHELGIAVGGNYKLAPGLAVVAEYQYMQRHQGGFDFNQGTLGRTVDGRGQGIETALVMNW
ncbi:MAG TPA: hypothetical protein DDZ81_24500 [Acetobacteraceae bacterium]|nr:hypothetical protein [Acetobacteraceae bacterium]